VDSGDEAFDFSEDEAKCVLGKPEFYWLCGAINFFSPRDIVSAVLKSAQMKKAGRSFKAPSWILKTVAIFYW